MKFCPKCSKTKSKLEFSRSKCRYDGLQSNCKPCMNAHTQKWYVENKERVRDQAKIRLKKPEVKQRTR